MLFELALVSLKPMLSAAGLARLRSVISARRFDISSSAFRQTIIEIEDLAPELRAKSREGAAFQLGMITSLADSIFSLVPETSPGSVEAEARLDQIKRMVRSVQAAVFAEPTTPAERAIFDFYR